MLELNPISLSLFIAISLAFSSVIFSCLLSSVIFVISSKSPEDICTFSGVFHIFSITLLPAKTTPVSDINTQAAIPIFLNIKFSFLFIAFSSSFFI